MDGSESPVSFLKCQTLASQGTLWPLFLKNTDTTLCFFLLPLLGHIQGTMEVTDKLNCYLKQEEYLLLPVKMRWKIDHSLYLLALSVCSEFNSLESWEGLKSQGLICQWTSSGGQGAHLLFILVSQDWTGEWAHPRSRNESMNKNV